MTNNQGLVSCIIIFFNAGAFLEESIESVFAQTYENWELLLVDDGSVDESSEIALHYAHSYPEKVRYHEHEGHQNRGMSATRNLGIRHAKGEYITFLDADDLWLVNTLDEQVAILNYHPDAAMVYGPIQWWYRWTENPEDTQQDFVDTPRVFLENPSVYLDTVIQPPTLLLLLLKGKISIAGMLVRRQTIEKLGGFEDMFRGLYEDQVFCAKICLQFPVFVASQWWYKYRQHPNSCCAIAQATRSDYWNLGRPAFLKWLESYLSQKGYKNTESWQVLQKEIWPYRHPIVNYLLNRTHRLLRRIKGQMKLIAQQEQLDKVIKSRI